MATDFGSDPLVIYLKRVPAVRKNCVGVGDIDGGGWWVKFGIDLSHKRAWQTVQELGHVLNYLSLNDRLPTVFKPVSPTPAMNGGPEDFLSWVIECSDPDFTREEAAEWLNGRLPNPVEREESWSANDNV